jgi:Fic family protein
VSTPSHYETVAIPRRERARLEQHGLRQEDRALAIFRASPRSVFTREQIEQALGFPTQTASRVLANLAARGAIVRTGVQATSSYGRTCGTWQLKPATPEQGRLL